MYVCVCGCALLELGGCSRGRAVGDDSLEKRFR